MAKGAPPEYSGTVACMARMLWHVLFGGAFASAFLSCSEKHGQPCADAVHSQAHPRSGSGASGIPYNLYAVNVVQRCISTVIIGLRSTMNLQVEDLNPTYTPDALKPLALRSPGRTC